MLKCLKRKNNYSCSNFKLLEINILKFIYILASLTFVLGLKLMSSPKTARKGNLIAAAGMTAAILGTIFLHGGKVPVLIYLLYFRSDRSRNCSRMAHSEEGANDKNARAGIHVQRYGRCLRGADLAHRIESPGRKHCCARNLHCYYCRTHHRQHFFREVSLLTSSSMAPWKSRSGFLLIISLI